MSLSIALLVTIVATGNSQIMQFYIEPQQKEVFPYVQQLVEGKIEKFQQGFNITASVSLVYDGGYYVIVDTPSATDINSKELMLRGIHSRNIAPGEIQLVVTTHGHPDHFGQGNFFPNARHFFGSYEYSDSNYINTELKTNSTMRLTPNIEIWNTPGHTSQDISVIVHKVPCCGTVAVVGDLFYDERDAVNGTEWLTDSWNPLIGKINREKVLCYADYIIPGHGKLFKITNEMRKLSSCEVPHPEMPESVVATRNSVLPSVVSLDETIRQPIEVKRETTTTSTAVPTTQRQLTTTTTTTKIATSTQQTPALLITVEHLPAQREPSVTEATTLVPVAYPVMDEKEMQDLIKGMNEALPCMNNAVNDAKYTEGTMNMLAPMVQSAAVHIAKWFNIQLTATAHQMPCPAITEKQMVTAMKHITNEMPQLGEAISTYTSKQARHPSAHNPRHYLNAFKSYRQRENY